MKVRKRAIVFICMIGPFRDNSDKLEPAYCWYGAENVLYCKIFKKRMCKSPFCYTIVTGPVTCVCAETLTILMELNVMLNTLFAVVFV